MKKDNSMQKGNNHADHPFSSKLKDERDMEIYVGKLLRYGVLTACAIALLGGLIYVLQHGGAMPDYRSESAQYGHFVGVPAYLRELWSIVPALFRLDGAAIIQFGVVVLIATPILRVAFSALAFWVEKDYLYVAITLLVLAIIAANMIFGLH